MGSALPGSERRKDVGQTLEKENDCKTSLSSLSQIRAQADGIEALKDWQFDPPDGVLENFDVGKGQTDVLYQITCRDVKAIRSKDFFTPKNPLEELVLLESEDQLSPQVLKVSIETTGVGFMSDWNCYLPPVVETLAEICVRMRKQTRIKVDQKYLPIPTVTAVWITRNSMLRKRGRKDVVELAKPTTSKVSR
jgi:hypothetical protein